MSVQHHRLEYDIDRTVAAIHKRKLPKAFAQMFVEGCNLDAVLAKETEA
jgi:hypothetical protein